MALFMVEGVGSMPHYIEADKFTIEGDGTLAVFWAEDVRISVAALAPGVLIRRKDGVAKKEDFWAPRA